MTIKQAEDDSLVQVDNGAEMTISASNEIGLD